MKLLALRHKLQANAAAFGRAPLDDGVVEAAECYINAREKRGTASRGG